MHYLQTLTALGCLQGPLFLPPFVLPEVLWVRCQDHLAKAGGLEVILSEDWHPLGFKSPWGSGAG